MRKTIACIICLACGVLGLNAQTCDTASFQRVYWIDNTLNSPVQKSVPDAYKNNYLMSNTVLDPLSNFSKQDALIIKTNPRGTVLWAKRLGYAKYDDIIDIAPTADNGVIAVGTSKSYNDFNDGEGWFFKLNADGEIVWSFDVGREYSEIDKIITLKNGDFAMMGVVFYDYETDDFGNFINIGRKYCFVIVIGADGKEKWTKEFTPLENVSAPLSLIPLSDSNFIFTGYKSFARPGGNSTSNNFIVKLNAADGSIIWEQTTDLGIAFGKELPGGDIRFYTSPDQDGVFNIFQADKDGNLKWCKQLTFNTPLERLYLVEGAPGGGGADVLLGVLRNGRSLEPLLFSLKDTSAIEWVHRYHAFNPGGFVFNPYAFYYNNQYFICTELEFDYTVHQEHQGYLIQTDPDGTTPCSTDYNLSIAKTNSYYTTFTSQYINAIPFQGKSTQVPVYSLPILVEQQIECYKTTCCRDTTIQNQVTICKGDTYRLPGGKVVDSASNYQDILKTSAGCDSIIYTNLYVQQPLKVSLGDDTCLPANGGITYGLSYAPDKVNYYWQNFPADSVYTITTAGTYTIKVTDQCTAAYDTVIVYRSCLLPVYIPTAFSPNNDGVNDVYRIADMNRQTLISFSIFNRYGEKIFTTNNASKGWDGTLQGQPQQPGTFVYYIVYADLLNITRILKGSFVLIR